MHRPSVSKSVAFVGTVSGLILGGTVIALDAFALAPLFFVVAIPTLLHLMRIAAMRWQDPFNPLSVIIGLGIVRFSLPALLVLIDTRQSLATPIYKQIGLDYGDIQAGHVLAVTGLLALALPWIFGRVVPRSFSNRRATAPAFHGALVVAIVGLIAWVLFVRQNGGSNDVLVSGAFRSLDIQEGTGQYFYGALLLISGSVFMSAWLIGRGWNGRVSVLPAVAASAAYFIMGGRARALTPLAAACLVMWWAGRRHRSSGALARNRIWPRVLLGSFAALWFFAVGASFRGGAGIDAASKSLSEFSIPKSKERLLVDIGQIHGMAAATKTGGGSTNGAILGAGLLWPVTEVTPVIEAPSAGVLILERTAGNIFGTRRWGLLPSISVEAYLDFAVPGLIGVGIIFGWALRRAYQWSRMGRCPPAIAALVIVYMVRIYFESIGKLSELWVVLAGIAAISLSTRLLIAAGHGRGSDEPGSPRAVPRPRRALSR